MFPQSSPDPELLRALRQGLGACGYTEPVLCERLGCATLHDYATGAVRGHGDPARDAVDMLFRLLLEGRTVARAELAALVPAELVAALEALEVIGPAADAPGGVAAAVALYPVEGVYIASDAMREFPDGRGDSVFPAINQSGAVYLAALPRTPCARFLELCSGTGIAALASARTAGHAWAVDITERSTAFARFNVALNDLPNVTVLQGDLYAPVAGLLFDRIVAHPPYMPALGERRIFRDGGADGELITRRVLAEAPAFLRPGGRLYCTCVATERGDAPLEQRVRGWLGESSADFDVLVLVTAASDPLVHFAGEIASRRRGLEEVAAILDAFRELKIASFVGCTIVLERHAAPRPPLTVRRRRGRLELGTAVDGVLGWEAFAQQPGTGAALAELRPRLAPGVRLQVLHLPRAGDWAARSCTIALDGPLVVELETSPEAARFLAWCDGTRTTRELLQRLVAEGAAPADAPADGFYAMVLALLREGVLQAELPETVVRAEATAGGAPLVAV